MEKENFSALVGINGYKAVVVISLAVVGVYSCIKLVNKISDSSVVVNANGKDNTDSK